MLVLDLDDTLLRDDLTISRKTKKAIDEVQKCGVNVVIATGRPTFATIQIAKEIGLHKYGGYIISYNGAVITKASTGKVMRQINISKENVQLLYKLSNQENANIVTYDKESIITPCTCEYIEIEKKLTGMNVIETNSFMESIPNELIKVMLLQEPSKLKTVAQNIKERIPDDLHMTFSKPFFLEFMNHQVDKSKSIEYLTKVLNINMDSVVAVGDSFNDMTMIQQAGLGVAMGNAISEVKDIADYITNSNMEDGIETIIFDFILNNKLAKVAN